jgi:hypothetical protein
MSLSTRTWLTRTHALSPVQEFFFIILAGFALYEARLLPVSATVHAWIGSKKKDESGV